MTLVASAAQMSNRAPPFPRPGFALCSCPHRLPGGQSHCSGVPSCHRGCSTQERSRACARLKADQGRKIWHLSTNPQRVLLASHKNGDLVPVPRGSCQLLSRCSTPQLSGCSQDQTAKVTNSRQKPAQTPSRTVQRHGPAGLQGCPACGTS